MSTAQESPCKRQRMSASSSSAQAGLQNPGSSSSAQAVLQNPSSPPVLQEPPKIHIVMYNPGIQETQVQCAVTYTKWITGKLKKDVTAAILKHDADMIVLCELGGIAEGLGPTLSKWKKTNRAAKPGDYHLVDEMLFELVSDADVIKKHPLGWSIYAVNHYGLLASKDTIRLVDEPHQVGPLAIYPWARVAVVGVCQGPLVPRRGVQR